MSLILLEGRKSITSIYLSRLVCWNASFFKHLGALVYCMLGATYKNPDDSGPNLFSADSHNSIRTIAAFICGDYLLG